MDDFDIDDYVWWLFGGYYSWNNRVIRPASGGKEKQIRLCCIYGRKHTMDYFIIQTTYIWTNVSNYSGYGS